MQTLARFVDFGGKRLEADRGIDEIAQDGLSDGGIACKIGVDRLGEERLAKAPIAPRASRDRLFEAPRECHLAPRLVRSLAMLVVEPAILCYRDCRLLTHLGAPGQEYHQRATFPAEVDPVPRSEIYPPLKHSATNAFDV